MISAVMLYSASGDLLLQRFFREDVTLSNLEAFRLSILGKGNAKNDGSSPIVSVDRVNFMYTRSGGIYLCAACRKNCDVTLVFQSLYSLSTVLKSYTGDANLDRNSVTNNAFLIYELLDEMFDYGYPQVCDAGLLGDIIKVGKVQLNVNDLARTQGRITQMVTGAVDWRDPDKHNYRKNEVYIDVLERINVIMAKGNVLNASVSGQLMMKTLLSGMPTCTFGLNDKIAQAVTDQENPNNRNKAKHTTINIDQLRFHRCVQLNKFEQERCISFVPPDGEFELANYRVSNDVSLPFHVQPNIEEKGRSRVEYEVQIKSAFNSKSFAQDVIIRLPCPPNTSRTDFKVTDGKTKYDPTNHVIIWKIKRFPGGSAAYRLKGEVKLAAGIKDAQWARPPITLEFTIPMWTASELQVRYLKVQEKSNYHTIKWVRYITKAGLYEIRI